MRRRQWRRTLGAIQVIEKVERDGILTEIEDGKIVNRTALKAGVVEWNNWLTEVEPGDQVGQYDEFVNPATFTTAELRQGYRN